ncbi:MAG: SUF system NifU family Fe-S cluster assembly protein [Oscillospiraceae bacterium]|nr:SUF system NifU family Fe-S cluster assembly protein [Oscillospiraceae bacterium]
MGDNIYNEVLIDHNLHPMHLHDLSCATCSNDGLNPTCGDSLSLHLNIENGVIKDGSFTGVGCAISQASTDIMLDLIIGRSTEDALHLKELFSKMINGDISQEEIDELEEAGALQNISKMPARVKCALLGWDTLEKLLKEEGAK